MTTGQFILLSACFLVSITCWIRYYQDRGIAVWIAAAIATVGLFHVLEWTIQTMIVNALPGGN